MRGFTRLVERLRRAPPMVADAGLAVAIFAIGVIDILYFQTDDPNVLPFHVGRTAAVPMFALMTLPLALRRRNIWLTYVLVQGASVAAGQMHLMTTFNLGWLLLSNVLVFSVAERANGLVTVGAVLGQLAYYYSLEFEVPAKNRTFVNDAIYFLPFFSFAAFAGWSQRRRRRLTAELEARVAEVQAERELLSGEAVAEERIRIARELRGLVVQGVDRMTSLAGQAGEDLVAGEDAARPKFQAIEATGRRTLVEMRRLLGVLRRSDRGPDVPSGGAPRVGSHAIPPIPTRGGLADRFRSWRGRPVLIDIVVVAALACLSTVEFIRSQPDAATMNGWAPKVLTVIILLSLLFRRRAPFTVLIVAASTEFVWILLRDNTPGSADRALLVAVYTVAAHKDLRWGAAGVGLALFAWSPLPVRNNLCMCLIDIGSLSTFAVIAGHSMLVGRRVNRELEEQTDLLRRTRAERVRLAVAEERVRVAREMHDVVAHWVTGMVVQAGGARMVLADDPALAATTLREIQQMGREALDELRGLVSALDPRDVSDRAEIHEDAYELDALIERVRRTGQKVVFAEQGDAHVDEGLQISVYRIVQEALTNVRKHATGASASVSVSYGPGGVDLVVSNGPGTGGHSTRGPVPGAGQGLLGISERASVFGGIAESGPTPDGGFRVHAVLPLELVPA